MIEEINSKYNNIDNDIDSAEKQKDEYKDPFGAESTDYTCDPSVAYPFYWDDTKKEVVCGRWAKLKPYNYTSIYEKRCAIEKCELEKLFIYEVARLIGSGNFQDDDRIRLIQDSDYKKFCPVSDGGAGGNSISQKSGQCCGVGIRRKKFNGLVSECCDGVVQDLGNCS